MPALSTFKHRSLFLMVGLVVVACCWVALTRFHRCYCRLGVSLFASHEPPPVWVYARIESRYLVQVVVVQSLPRLLPKPIRIVDVVVETTAGGRLLVSPSWRKTPFLRRLACAISWVWWWWSERRDEHDYGELWLEWFFVPWAKWARI